jgi:acyl-coenzyme A thioesterase PaaI-like protein
MSPHAAADGRAAADPAREQAAAAVRELSHALVGRDLPARLLGDIADTVGRLSTAAEAAPVRRRQASGMLDDLRAPAPPGSVRSHYAACPIDGRANPLSTPLQVAVEGVDVVVRVTLGPAHEGAPGRVHGGVVAALVDEAMGYVVAGLMGEAAFQGELRVRYVAPVPIGEELELRARLLIEQGRRLIVGLTVRAGDVEVVRASGVHVRVGFDRVGPPGHRSGHDGWDPSGGGRVRRE